MASKKSKRIEDKPVFQNFFHKLAPEIQKIFEELRTRAVAACETQDWGYTEKGAGGDFRIAHEQTIVELVPKKSHVLVMLRVDRHPPESFAATIPTISLSEARESGKPGKRWVEFSVQERSQIADAVKLIDHVYKRRRAGGW